MFWTALQRLPVAHLSYLSTQWAAYSSSWILLNKIRRNSQGVNKDCTVLYLTCTNKWQPGHLLKQKHSLLIMTVRPNFFRKETRIEGCWFENLLSRRRIVEDCNIFNKLELELLAGCVFTCNRSMLKLVSTLHVTSPKMADMVEMLQGSMWSLLHFTWASFIFHF